MNKNLNLRNDKYPDHTTPPLLAIEILSPGTHDHDRINKAIEYRAAGLKDYLIVNLHKETVEVVFGNVEVSSYDTWFKFDWTDKIIKLDKIFL